ncbi:hypothetical protein ACQE3E_03160 [Methylomonas sp. MED-D]|uniref:hypothetical protein n=1 Tax=Methylomonas sp. MED-D TaxID=3418768 RepID=UPI003D03B438
MPAPSRPRRARARAVVKPIWLRLLSVASQGLFLLVMQWRWPFAEIGEYMSLLALFNLSTLLTASGLDKQLIRRRAALSLDKAASDALIDRAATYAGLISLAWAAGLFATLYPEPLSAGFGSMLLFCVAGCGFRIHAAKIADPERYAELLDAQLAQATALRLGLTAALVWYGDALQIVTLELLGGCLSNLRICRHYRLNANLSLRRLDRDLVYQAMTLFFSKLLQQLGVRYLLLIPAAQADFGSAGLFGFLQKVCGLVTNIADFVLQRLHVRHGLFRQDRDLGDQYRRGARWVLATSVLLSTGLAALALALEQGWNDTLLAALAILAGSPFLVWRTTLSNAITQRQVYWVSPLSYLPATALLALLAALELTQPLALALALLVNTVLNVATAKLLLAWSGAEGRSA